jgi:DnaJ-class molecular chaperone
LSDPSKKQEFDNFGGENINTSGSTGDFFHGNSFGNDMFSDIFKKYRSSFFTDEFNEFQFSSDVDVYLS